MITNILRILLFVLIIIAFLCFYELEPTKKESFSQDHDEDKKKTDRNKLLAYLAPQTFDNVSSTPLSSLN